MTLACIRNTIREREREDFIIMANLPAITY